MGDLQARPELNLTHGQSPILQVRAICGKIDRAANASEGRDDAARHQEEMLRLSRLIAAPAAKGKQGGSGVNEPE